MLTLGVFAKKSSIVLRQMVEINGQKVQNEALDSQASFRSFPSPAVPGSLASPTTSIRALVEGSGKNLSKTFFPSRRVLRLGFLRHVK